MEKITIGKLAEMSGVGVETVRFYQRKELLELNTKPRMSCGKVKAKTEAKIHEIKTKNVSCLSERS